MRIASLSHRRVNQRVPSRTTFNPWTWTMTDKVWSNIFLSSHVDESNSQWLTLIVSDFTDYFAMLSDELVLQVFRRLPIIDLTRLNVVCKRWHRLMQDSSLWNRFDLAHGIIMSDVLIKFLNRGIKFLGLNRSEVNLRAFTHFIWSWSSFNWPVVIYKDSQIYKETPERWNDQNDLGPVPVSSQQISRSIRVDVDLILRSWLMFEIWQVAAHRGHGSYQQHHRFERPEHDPEAHQIYEKDQLGRPHDKQRHVTVPRSEHQSSNAQFESVYWPQQTSLGLHVRHVEKVGYWN